MSLHRPDPDARDHRPAGEPDAEDGQPRRGTLRRWAPLAVLVAALGLVFALDLDRFVSLEMLRQHRDMLDALVAENALVSGLGFLVVYAVMVAISLPGGVLLTLAGGFLFGVVWGSVLVVAGATLGAVTIFLAARSALGETLRRRAGGWVRRLEGGFRENAASYLLTLRLIPLVPFWLLNIVPAFLGVSLTTYTLTTLVGIIPGTVVYTAVGNGLGATLDMGQDPDLAIIFQPEILLPLIGLAILSLVPVVYKQLRARRAADGPA